MIAELRKEREQVDAAIVALQQFELTRTKRPGRPPKWLTEAKAAAPTKKDGRPKASKKPLEQAS